MIVHVTSKILQETLDDLDFLLLMLLLLKNSSGCRSADLLQLDCLGWMAETYLDSLVIISV